MPTPLYDVLRSYADREPVRFHMPGHKGILDSPADLKWMAPIDVTELPETGNLYEAGEPFDSAQRLWAELFGFDQCQFLTGGSTMGIHTGLALCAKPGSKILVDRNCHRAVFNALALLDLEPLWLERPWLESENLPGSISPEIVEKMLSRNPDIQTVCITSPTYAGVLSNIGVISRMVHAHGGKLFVDGAHGAHLPFLGPNPFQGADVITVSAHKTLPAMGQTALLFASGFDSDLVRRTASIFGTSSPSYPMLANLDVVRDWMVNGGAEKYRQAVVQVGELRQKFPSLKDEPCCGFSLDPARFVLKVENGPAFVQALGKRGYVPEMEDGGHVIFICTCQDAGKAMSCLAGTLEELRNMMGDCSPIPAPPIPERVLSPRAALFSTSRVRPLEDCEGEIAACQIAPYPPGVPVVAPGERISKKELAYLKKIGYNMLSEIRTVIL